MFLLKLTGCRPRTYAEANTDGTREIRTPGISGSATRRVFEVTLLHLYNHVFVLQKNIDHSGFGTMNGKLDSET